MRRSPNPFRGLDRLNQTVEATRAFLSAGGQLPARRTTALGRAHRLLLLRLSRGMLPWDTFHALESLPGWKWPVGLSGAELRAYRVASWRQHFHRTYGNRAPGRRDYPAGVTTADLELVRRMHRQGRLAARLVAMFERLPNWQWTPGRGGATQYGMPHAEQLARQVASVEAHVASTHHSFVRRDDASDVATSIRQLRRLALREELPDTMRATLGRLPGWAWSNAAAVPAMKRAEFVGALRTFATEFGHCRVPPDFRTTEGFPLGERLTTILRRTQTGKLDQALAAELHGLPGWGEVVTLPRVPSLAATTVLSDPVALLASVRQAAVRYGHVAIPSSLVVDGVRIGAHVAALRAMRPHLSPAVIGTLEAMPGWFWNGLDAQVWLGVRRTAAAAAAFVATMGHGRIPASYDAPDGYPLGAKVRAVAAKIARGAFDARHTALFAAIPGWSFEALSNGSARVGAARITPTADAARVHAAPHTVARAQLAAQTPTHGGL